MGKRIGANRRKRIAQRRGKRRRGFARFLLTGVLYAVLLSAGTALFVHYKGRLPDIISMAERLRRTKVTGVEIQGAVHMAPEEILRRSGIRFPIMKDQLKREYLDALSRVSPWIDKVRLMATRNGIATIGVIERQPVAMLQIRKTATVALVDAEGVFLPLDPHKARDLPLISGLTDSAGEGGIHRLTEGDCGRMDRFFHEAAQLDSSFIRRITQVHFAPGRIAHVLLSGSPTVITVGEDNAALQLQRFMQVWEAVSGDSLPPARVDLSYRNLAFVTTAAAAPDMTAGGGGTRRVKAVAAGAAGKKNKG
jgi:cell division septal protein FtsQ